MKGSQEGPADFAHDFRGSVLVGGWSSVRTEVLPSTPLGVGLEEMMK